MKGSHLPKESTHSPLGVFIGSLRHSFVSHLSYVGLRSPVLLLPAEKALRVPISLSDVL